MITDVGEATQPNATVEQNPSAPALETTEVATESKAPAEPAPKLTDLSHQFATLSRKEKKIIDREKSLKEWEEKLSQRAKDYELIDKDPYEYLQKKDPNAYTKWTERILNDGKPGINESLSDLEKRVEEKWASRVDGLEKKVQEYEEQYQKAQLDHFVGGIKTTAKGEKYELIQAQGEDGIGAVYHYIMGHLEKHGKLLSYEEGCDAIEEALYEQAKQIQKLKKLQPAQPEPSTRIPEGQKDSRPTTLTNTLTSQAAPREKRTLTREESIAEAARLIKFV